MLFRSFVKSNDVLIVDDYDAINEDLSPFWDLDSAELKRRASLVRTLLCLIQRVI